MALIKCENVSIGYEGQTVVRAPDTGMRFAPFFCECIGLHQGVFQGVDIDIVVASSVHFGKFYLHISVFE